MKENISKETVIATLLADYSVHTFSTPGEFARFCNETNAEVNNIADGNVCELVKGASISKKGIAFKLGTLKAGKAAHTLRIDAFVAMLNVSLVQSKSEFGVLCKADITSISDAIKASWERKDAAALRAKSELVTA